jgi:hypothetical protein
MFWWINVQDDLNSGAICLTVFTIACVGHVISTFSALGRMIMMTSAMGNVPILPRGDEEAMLPHQLTNVLLQEAGVARQLDTKVNQQYRLNNNDNIHNDDPLTYEMSLRRRYPHIELNDVV